MRIEWAFGKRRGTFAFWRGVLSVVVSVTWIVRTRAGHERERGQSKTPITKHGETRKQEGESWPRLPLPLRVPVPRSNGLVSLPLPALLRRSGFS